MPLLDIATAQPNLISLRSQSLYHNHRYATFLINNEFTAATARWRQISIPYKPKKLDRWWRYGGFIVKAVATVEPTCVLHQNNGNLSLEMNSMASEKDPVPEDIDGRELLRRDRISKANTGKRPWNLGRKHSPETRELIRQRTWLAMQNPKIRMKLQNLGHAQSEETRNKISNSVRTAAEKRRQKKMLQETCRFEWENLVAEASRKGFYGEEELQWNSYKILEKQILQEWLNSREERKKSPAIRGNRRAPKTLEQRRKIAAAVAAKWADPEYRERVSYGLARFHDSRGRVTKPRKRAPSGEKPKTRSPVKKAKPITNSIDMPKQVPKLRKSKGPSYKDPLANSKLEMLKNIRAQRAAAESTRSEAITRAKLLIAEAQKAAQALEISATFSPLAQASLIEARKHIAEAIESIGSIDTDYPDADQIHKSSSFASPDPLKHEKVNGFKTLPANDENLLDFDFSNVSQELLDSLEDDDGGADDDDDDLRASLYNVAFESLLPGGSNDFEVAKLELENMINHASFSKQFGDFTPNGAADQSEAGEMISQQRFGNIELDNDGDQQSMQPVDVANLESEKEQVQLNLPTKTKTKKWVRGKLVEVEEGD